MRRICQNNVLYCVNRAGKAKAGTKEQSSAHKANHIWLSGALRVALTSATQQLSMHLPRRKGRIVCRSAPINRLRHLAVLLCPIHRCCQKETVDTAPDNADGADRPARKKAGLPHQKGAYIKEVYASSLISNYEFRITNSEFLTLNYLSNTLLNSLTVILTGSTMNSGRL